MQNYPIRVINGLIAFFVYLLISKHVSTLYRGNSKYKVIQVDTTNDVIISKYKTNNQTKVLTNVN